MYSRAPLVYVGGHSGTLVATGVYKGDRCIQPSQKLKGISYDGGMLDMPMEDTLEACFDTTKTEEKRLQALSEVNVAVADFGLIETYDLNFIELLDSPNKRVRINAIEILGNIKSKSAVEPLISMITNATQGVTGELSPILCSLWEINDRRAIGPILELAKTELESGDMDSAMTALEILQFKGEVIIPNLDIINVNRYDLKIIEG